MHARVRASAAALTTAALTAVAALALTGCGGGGEEDGGGPGLADVKGNWVATESGGTKSLAIGNGKVMVAEQYQFCTGDISEDDGLKLIVDDCRGGKPPTRTSGTVVDGSGRKSLTIEWADGAKETFEPAKDQIERAG
ncbi:hypothetical protein DVA86_19880 [Streptomyces armeniacus]|uniref:Lipoprotein n=2 Tax=Streptomyces armeniacus TaxID=83291 RepID=A0A345XSF4_9ACTN|nr:hypothetical protein DVA86_19880 [Streptomyces armeniacus]